MPTNKNAAKNLQPGKHKQKLKKGGSKGRARSFLTSKEIDFCSYMAQMGIIRRAAYYAEIPVSTAQDLMRRPRILAAIKEFEEKYKQVTSERDAARQEERKEVTHREFLHRLMRFKTHRFRGDEAAVKLIEIGFKSTGEIQPSKNVNQASASSGANAETSGHRVTIEYIGRPQDQAAAQAKFAGRAVE